MLCPVSRTAPFGTQLMSRIFTEQKSNGVTTDTAAMRLDCRTCDTAAVSVACYTLATTELSQFVLSRSFKGLRSIRPRVDLPRIDPPQVRSFRPRFMVDPPQVLGHSSPTELSFVFVYVMHMLHCVTLSMCTFTSGQSTFLYRCLSTVS